MTAGAISKQSIDCNPLPGHGSDRYREEYIASFVMKWDQLIDWDRRSAAEGSFFIDTLKAHGARTVLDVATGTGFHSIRLQRSGFDVTSVDGSEQMLERAAANAQRYGLQLSTIHADWRWLGRRVEGAFDALICLGNSFTHLFDEADRRRALAEYHALLRPGGLLILDQRNYDALLDHGTHPRHKFYYCGKDVCARPIHVDASVARFRYEFSDGAAYHLDMFPLRKAYMRELLADAGFKNVKTFGDFKAVYSETEPDFLIHVAEKEMRPPHPDE
ncbi:MAG: class I SAM-dependent methyltransferase [Rhodomicrobium sp.]